ncbi:type II toxin-antitoxin system YoeB family toxin [Kitasatospora sp. NPDC127059]|uniref:type II toxin-antitoxin system YoeB family toxin n=1 Tax=unclassified Kitasatospora TaxID=2633591 RepID=UPI00364DC869
MTAPAPSVPPPRSRPPRPGRFSRGDLAGHWSRRIDDEHRRVHRADEKEVRILRARYHYRQPGTRPAPPARPTRRSRTPGRRRRRPGSSR